MNALRTCRECYEEYVANPSVRADNGFCSDPCEAQYDREFGADVVDLVEQIAKNGLKPSNIMVDGVEIGYPEDDCRG